MAAPALDLVAHDLSAGENTASTEDCVCVPCEDCATCYTCETPVCDAAPDCGGPGLCSTCYCDPCIASNCDGDDCLASNCDGDDDGGVGGGSCDDGASESV